MSDFVADLSNQEQELVTGGADFELSGSNYANRIVVLRGNISSGPNGSFANSSAYSSNINTAAQDLLGMGLRSLPRLRSLGIPPIL